jgi:hypothetical protein
MKRLRSLVSMALVAVGAVLLVDRIGGLTEVRPLLTDWWPILIIAVGVANLGRSTTRPWAVWGPLLVVLAGFTLLLWRLDKVPPMVSDLFLPTLLLVLGPLIAFAGTQEQDTDQGWVRQRAVLGRKHYVSTAKAFRYGKFSAWFGHLDLDLRHVRCHELGADLVLTAICGQVNVRLPEGWRVDLQPPVRVAARGRSLHPTGVSADAADSISVYRLEVLGRADLTPP